MNSLIHFHDYAQKSNKIDVLWKIFMGTPSMSNLDQIILCEMLLTSYSKEYISLDIFQKSRLFCTLRSCTATQFSFHPLALPPIYMYEFYLDVNISVRR